MGRPRCGFRFEEDPWAIDNSKLIPNRSKTTVDREETKVAKKKRKNV